MNGEVRAIYAKAPQKPISITSMNGEVDLRLPADTKANIRMRTHNGSILTDFSEDTLKTKSEGSKHGGYGYNNEEVAREVTREVTREVARAVKESAGEDGSAPAAAPRAPPARRAPRCPRSPAASWSPAPSTAVAWTSRSPP
jgi:hypothetical protein